jgi:hypothetical protein
MIGGGAWGAGFETENDVWSSTDGISWTDVTDSAPWPPRMGHSLVVYDDKMWVLGGGDHSGLTLNDVWYSSDGENWTCADSSAGWTARESQYAAVMNNTIWILAGRSAAGNCFNDVWRMSNQGISDETFSSVMRNSLQVFPCPSSSSVTISYDLPVQGKVKIDIYDLSGHRIDTVTDSFQSAGSGSAVWDRNTASGGRAGKGVYFCRLEFNGNTVTDRIILI